MYICVCVFVCIYILVVCIMRVCMYVRLYLYLCVCSYVCMYTCLYVFIYWFGVHMYMCMHNSTETVRSTTFYIPFWPSAADKPSIPLVCPSYCLAGSVHFSTLVDHLLSAVRGRRYLSTLLIFISCKAVFVTPFSLIVRKVVIYMGTRKRF
jgi:hypothetical protein